MANLTWVLKPISSWLNWQCITFNELHMTQHWLTNTIYLTLKSRNAPHQHCTVLVRTTLSRTITQDDLLVLLGWIYLLVIKLSPGRNFRKITQTVLHSMPLFSPKEDQRAVQGVNYFSLSLFEVVSNYGFLITLIFSSTRYISFMFSAFRENQISNNL